VNRYTAAAVALTVIVVAAGCGGTQPPLTITGHITAGYNLYSSDWRTGACFGTGDAAALSTGAQVTVTDAANATIAVGTLTDPQLMEADLLGSGDRSGLRTVGCRYTFTVTGVPAGHQFYGLRVGGQTRQVPAGAATAPVELTIGSVPADATPAG
jgi:hypothetical protein